MEKITTILFDLDGTLLDTREAIFQAFVHSLTTLGHKVPSKEEMFLHVGKEFSEMVAGVVGSMENNKEIKELMTNFQFQNLHLVAVYSGTAEVLKELRAKGYKLGAVTNAKRGGTLKRLQHVGILDLFDTVVAVDDVDNPKPFPDPVLLALKNIGALPENAVMVGDSHFDIEAGKSAGTKTVRVTYGFHSNEMDNPTPDHFIDDIKEIFKLI